ncbi:hypothetical protein HOLDEFILI_00445 [Holdemania filiformis DSM 12042]|uniref:Uncharacterized protein n=1 Tax=Holdemania filiformis DSM 12042 TaxID=545696 RepID=B9Y3R5_9FIRM|nr:hypothetical protein HOLDEFILI_00445 [Holdemania filiformis DSM 12042]
MRSFLIKWSDREEGAISRCQLPKDIHDAGWLSLFLFAAIRLSFQLKAHWEHERF